MDFKVIILKFYLQEAGSNLRLKLGMKCIFHFIMDMPLMSVHYIVKSQVFFQNHFGNIIKNFLNYRASQSEVFESI